jgi:apolipoprotein D and lipocalin family protein
VHLQGRGVVAAVLLGALVRVGGAQGVRAVGSLEPGRFVGTWYEVARYPYKRERACVRDTVLLVALADKANELQFVNSCEDKKGYQDVRNSTARGPKVKAGAAGSGAGSGANHGAGNGEFKVTSVWPFSTKIWVLGLAADNSWSVLGSPDRKHLWIFSKTRVMDAAALAQAEAVAGGEGFDLGKLTMTPGVSAGAAAGTSGGR